MSKKPKRVFKPGDAVIYGLKCGRVRFRFKGRYVVYFSDNSVEFVHNSQLKRNKMAPRS